MRSTFTERENPIIIGSSGGGSNKKGILPLIIKRERERSLALQAVPRFYFKFQ